VKKGGNARAQERKKGRQTPYAVKLPEGPRWYLSKKGLEKKKGNSPPGKFLAKGENGALMGKKKDDADGKTPGGGE